MGTDRSFQSMLNEYLPNELLAEELIKRDYILTNVPKDENWKGGNLVVPFKRAGATSVTFGGLTSSSDIAQSDYQRGGVSDYIECWGSLIFNHRDLQEHNGKIPESTFLRILPDEVDDFMDYMKQVVSIQLGSGPQFATLLGDGQAGGTAVVDHIDRFQIGQEFILDDGNSAIVTTYVTGVDVNTGAIAGYPSSGTITVSATRGGGPLNIAAYTVAQGAKCYHPGTWDGSTATTFTSMRNALLSLANGGSTTLHGKTKTASPILQAVNIDGSGISSTNLLDKLFDAYTEVRARAKGNANTYLMSFKHLGSVMKALEVQKGSFLVTKQANPSLYGWTEIQITSVKGTLNIVGIQEMDDDIIPIIDWNSMMFYSNGGFKKRMSPDGKEYFEVRNTTGYQYIVDTSFFGEMVYKKPGHNGIIYGIPAYT
jgi:hypothetical protein